jgi:dihydroxyacetone kinase-like protein
MGRRRAMKKLINDPRRVVAESIAGLGAAHQDILSVSAEPAFVVRREKAPGKVALVSGGGSGHAPLHGGFVGVGMLDAEVPGELFTSPTPDPIVAATRAVSGGAGVLYIVKNYTGDVLNFETAAELAALDGTDVRTVIVDDDIAVKDSLYTAGRRGVAGTVLVEKIAGAAAERGDGIDAVERIARQVAASTRSMGVGLAPPIVPHSGVASFELAEDEIEFGIGIHGEPGRERRHLEPVDALVDAVIDAIDDDLPFTRGAELLLVVNGMGGTPLGELYIAYRRAAEVLGARGVRIVRSLVGNYVTSLEMHGFSITVLALDDELTTLWDAPVHTAALRWRC